MTSLSGNGGNLRQELRVRWIGGTAPESSSRKPGVGGARRRSNCRIRGNPLRIHIKLLWLVKAQCVAMLEAWDNEISARTVPKRYTSRELVRLAEEFGWMLVSVRGDHHNFKHPASRFIVTIVHPQKDISVGRAVDTVKKIRLELK